MRIRFFDTGETFVITGERRQFWLFDKNGEPGKAIKGSDAYQLLDGDGTLPRILDYTGITVRDELEGFEEAEETEDFANVVQDGDEKEVTESNLEGEEFMVEPSSDDVK